MALPRPAADTQVIVTGAASGIGREVARELARLGYNLVIADIQEEALHATGNELRGVYSHLAVEDYVIDLTKDDQRKDLIAKVQAGEREVVGVCNVAGLISIGRFDAQPFARERVLVDVSVAALHHLTGAFLPGMQARGEGAIMNVASPAGIMPLPYLASYSAAKAFVWYFSLAMHAELKGSGVSVTTLMPGATKTPLAFGINETSFMPAWAWKLPVFRDPGATAKAGIKAMVKGRRLATPGFPEWFLVGAGRYVPPGLAGPVMRLGGTFAFPGPNDAIGRSFRAAFDALGSRIGSGVADEEAVRQRESAIGG